MHIYTVYTCCIIFIKMVKKILMKSKEVIPLFIHPYNEHMVHARYCFGFCSYKNK